MGRRGTALGRRIALTFIWIDATFTDINVLQYLPPFRLAPIAVRSQIFLNWQKAFKRGEQMRKKDMLLSFRGRLLRQTFWAYSLALWIIFILLFMGFERAFGHASTLLLYPPFFLALLALITKRLHDRNKRGAWVLLVLIPIAGPILLVAELGFLRGSAGPNRYGRDPSESYPDYQIVK